MCAPGVAIASRVTWRFKGSLEVLLREITPEVEPLQEEVATPETEVRLEEVMREVNRALRQILRRDESVECALRPVGRQGVCEDREALRVFREAVLRG